MSQTESLAGFRLSPQQERVAAVAGAAGFPAAVCLYSCSGPVSVEALGDALRGIVSRHEILRTIFPKQRELTLPLQVILDEATPDIRVESLVGLSDEEQRGELRRRFDEAARAVGKASEAPTVSATVFELSEDKHALLIALPGMSADAASFRVLAEELRGALSGGVADDDLIQYADVTEWHHDLLGGTEDAAVAAKAFWQGLWHTPAMLPLEVASADHAGVAVDAVAVPVAKADVERLRSFAKSSGSSEADVLLAVWHLLLNRVTGENRTVVLAASEGREYDELKNAIGLFSRYLPVAVEMEGKSRFEDVLRQVATLSKHGRDQQDWFTPGSAAAKAAIGFEYLDLRNTPGNGAVEVDVLAVHVSTENLKLRLIAADTADGLAIELEYDRNRYAAESVEQLASSFRVLLSQVLADPLASPQSYSLLADTTKQTVLAMGAGPSVAYPWLPIHELMCGAAEAPAVRSGADVLSYGELGRRSSRLAHYLAKIGVKRGSLVGLCVARTANMMTPVLGILKAGGAYVPLRADQPKARTAQQLEGLDVLVTEAQFVEHLPSFAGHLVVLDGAERPWEQEPDAAVEVEVGSDDLAYVIYTSGSTGTPKGVGVKHGNLVNYATHIVRTLELDKEPLQYATVSTLAADLGNTVIYPALLTGGCLHVLPYEIATDAKQMAAYQAEHGIDVLKIVPSHLAALVEAGGEAVLPRKFLITGGEALKPALVECVSASCEVVNHYGPTETTVGSLMLRLKDFDWKSAATATVPIGRPIANTRVYVLDQNRELVPVGVAGELYIAGAGVSAGYVGQPEMTAERFVADPFVAGERMYRTGDLVRWLPSGVVEFLGRADDQVKIRGFRVELGEIETVLAKEPGVRQCVVIARGKAGSPDDKQVVAYVVLDRQQGTTAEILKQALKERLPDYMVPSAMVELAKLPLTANGKVDRKNLPEPEERVREYKAPSTVTEELVAQIWAEVLKLERISTDESFFDLGGHSLLATQVISRVRRVLGVDIPLRTMFDTPTVAAVAARIDLSRLSGDDAVPAMQRVERDGPLPLSYAQQRLWILDQMDPDNNVYNIPRTWRLRGDLNVSALTRSLNEIIRRHEPLRTWFGVENGQPVQHIESAVELRVNELDLRTEPAEGRDARARQIVAEEVKRPFDLSVAPLLRALLLRLDEQEHVLVLTMHHIVSDAWSATIFLQELRAFYEGFVKGSPAGLPELALQYADYAAWQRDWLQGETLSKQLAFWRGQLDGVPPLLTLPTDRPRPEKQSFAGDSVRFTLPPEVAVPLKALCRKEGVTLFMALLAAYQTLLSRMSGQDQVVVGTDSANRFTVETERMIGFFINLLPLTADLSGDPTFRELLATVRETTLACYARQEMPFDKIVEELRPERTLSHNPLLQVLFVMQNVASADRQLGSVEISGFGTALTTSKFDIAAFAMERGDSVECIWVYSTELFDAETMAGMGQMFTTLLTEATAEPDTRVSSLKMYSEEQQQKIKEQRLERKQSIKQKLMSVGLKNVIPDGGAAK